MYNMIDMYLKNVIAFVIINIFVLNSSIIMIIEFRSVSILVVKMYTAQRVTDFAEDASLFSNVLFYFFDKRLIPLNDNLEHLVFPTDLSQSYVLIPSCLDPLTALLIPLLIHH